MTEAADWQKNLVNESLYLRGRLVASYSQVEFLLADISVTLDLKFPYRISDRIKAAKRIGEREQFAKYQAELDKVCDKLLEFDELRNFMSHAFLRLNVDKVGNHQFEYRMTHRSLDKDAPVSRPVQRTGIIGSQAILGGLHHHYVRV